MPDSVGWFAVIYADGSHDLVGSVRRSRRLHWTMKEARQEMENWVRELGLGKISWDTVDDDVIVARLPRHIAVISNIHLPLGEPLALTEMNGASYGSAVPPPNASLNPGREIPTPSSVHDRDRRSRHHRIRRTVPGSARRT